MFKTELLLKKEPYLFYFFLLLHILPVFFLTPFISLDGASHLYNSRLIHTLIAEPTSLASRFFDFNQFPEPNWICHILNSILMYFFPAWIVEKVIILIILVLSSIGFRILTFELNPQSGWMSWLYFPLLYNFSFSLGFYNFSMGFSLLSFVLVFWIRNRNYDFKFYHYLFLIMISAVLYFSHIIIFILAGIFMFIISLKELDKKQRNKFANQLKSLVITFLPGIIFAISFVIIKQSSSSEEIIYNSFRDRINAIISAGMLVFFDFYKECVETRFYFLVLAGFSLWAIINRSIHPYQKSIFLIAILSFLLIFIIPNQFSSGSIITVRIVQLFYFTWMIWLVTLNIPIKGRIFIAIVSVIFSLFFLARNYSGRKELSKIAAIFLEASKLMESGSIVMPLNYNQNWLHVHFCDYLGVEKNIIVLKNYEAVTGHFPLVWKKGMNPELFLGDFAASRNPCFNINRWEKNTGLRINYITIQDQPEHAFDSCSKSAFQQIDSLFVPMLNWKNEYLKIYKRK